MSGFNQYNICHRTQSEEGNNFEEALLYSFAEFIQKKNAPSHAFCS